jgi:integrase
MAASKWIGPKEGLRPLVFSNLVGLLYSTGLRIGEALKLTIGDVDLKRRLIHIREGKFKKSRYVPLSKSTADHLAAYLHRRQRAGFPISSTSPVRYSCRRQVRKINDCHYLSRNRPEDWHPWP